MNRLNGKVALMFPALRVGSAQPSRESSANEGAKVVIADVLVLKPA